MEEWSRYWKNQKLEIDFNFLGIIALIEKLFANHQKKAHGMGWTYTFTQKDSSFWAVLELETGSKDLLISMKYSFISCVFPYLCI